MSAFDMRFNLEISIWTSCWKCWGGWGGGGGGGGGGSGVSQDWSEGGGGVQKSQIQQNWTKTDEEKSRCLCLLTWATWTNYVDLTIEAPVDRHEAVR